MTTAKNWRCFWAGGEIRLSKEPAIFNSGIYARHGFLWVRTTKSLLPDQEWFLLFRFSPPCTFFCRAEFSIPLAVGRGRELAFNYKLEEPIPDGINMEEVIAFQRSLMADPDSPTNALIFADWCEEQGWETKCRELRKLGELLMANIDVPANGVMYDPKQKPNASLIPYDVHRNYLQGVKT